MLNTQDKDFQLVLVDLGFIDDIQMASSDSNGEVETDSNEKIWNEDYDVDELLSASMAL